MRCRSCNAPVLWAVTDHGKRIPLDDRPVTGGNVRLVTGCSPMRAVVGNGTIDMFDPDDDGVRYVAHFVSCPNADEWRTT